MRSIWLRHLAFVLFYASFTVLPVVGWLIGHFSEYMSYSLLLFLAVAPLLGYVAIKTILNEDPFCEHQEQQDSSLSEPS